jgi:TolB-like protein
LSRIAVSAASSFVTSGAQVAYGAIRERQGIAFSIRGQLEKAKRKLVLQHHFVDGGEVRVSRQESP